MSEDTLVVLVVVALVAALIAVICLVGTIGMLGLNLKMYSEYAKDMAQNRRAQKAGGETSLADKIDNAAGTSTADKVS